MSALLLLILFGCTSKTNAVDGDPIDFKQAAGFWETYKRLSGDQITAVFRDVVDKAKVVDGDGGSAINHWYRDGRFTSNWKVAQRSGKLSGNWFVKKDLRCVTLDTEVAGLKANQERCGPIYSKDDKYYSVNKGGQVHGVHSLTKFKGN